MLGRIPKSKIGQAFQLDRLRSTKRRRAFRPILIAAYYPRRFAPLTSARLLPQNHPVAATTRTARQSPASRPEYAGLRHNDRSALCVVFRGHV